MSNIVNTKVRKVEVKNKLSMQEDDYKVASDDLDRSNRLRSDSGNIDFSDALTTFFYLLLRDELQAGKVERIIMEVVEGPEHVSFTNGFLAKYAENLANYLKGAKLNTLSKALESAFTSSKADEFAEAHRKRKNREDFFCDGVWGELEKKVNAAKLDELQDNAEHMVEELDRDAKIKEYLSSIEKLKELVDVDRVNKVADILKHEVEKELEESDTEDIEEDDVIVSKNATTFSEEENDEVTEKVDEFKGMAWSNLKNNMVEDRLLELEAVKEDGRDEKVKRTLNGEDDDESQSRHLWTPPGRKTRVDDIVNNARKQMLETRENILKLRAQENKERTSGDEKSKEEAVEYVKEKIEEATIEEAAVQNKDRRMLSRGTLGDVRGGRAFPEALGDVFKDSVVDVEEIKRVHNEQRRILDDFKSD